MVKVLCYKSEGRWFSPRWCHYHSRKPSDHPLVLGSTQPLTEMCTRNIFCGQRRPVRKDDNLPPSWAVVRKSGNLNFLEPSGPLQVCNGSALPLPLPDISNNSQRKLLLLGYLVLQHLFINKTTLYVSSMGAEQGTLLPAV